MKLEELHQKSMDYSSLRYDPRLGHVYDAQAFESYKTNPGHTYYLYLRNLVRYLKPRHIVELGTSIGRSGLFMMLELPEGSKFTTLELSSFQRVDLAPFYNDRRMHMVYGDDTDIQVYGPLGLSDIDFLFIDSLHEKDHVVKEWAIYKNFLQHGAIVVMDDIRINAGLIEFWNSIPYPKISCPDSIHFSGFGIFEYHKD